MARPSPSTLDIVIPVFDEEEVIDLLFERLDSVFSEEARATHGLDRVRYLFVDDGSRDRTAALIAERIEQGATAVLLRFSRNFGHQNAVTAGLDHAEADTVAVIDADLQDPPETLLEMLAQWREGSDVVYAQRRKRKENFVKRFCYWAFYRLVAFLSEIDIPLDSGDFCLMDRRVVLGMRKLPEKLRFPRGLRAWVGYRQTGVTYDRPARQAGTSKYNFSKLYRLATDGIASSSTRPLKAAQFFSQSFFLLAMIILTYLGWLLATGAAPAVPRTLIVGNFILVLGQALQMACLYILGAYVGRTYLEAKGRPPYIVMEVVGEAADGEEPRKRG